MEEGIDTGVILDQTPFEIEASDDMMTVYRKACAIAGERICAVMDQVARDGLRGAEQDPALATYDGKPTDADAQVDWSRPAAEIDRLVRGLTPAKMPRFPYRGSQIFIAKSRFSSEAVDAAPGTVLKNGNPPRIATGEGWIDLQVAFCRRPFPWIWPSPFNRPRVGERLDP
jgi:methionyl-tRNA formyltransferase